MREHDWSLIKAERNARKDDTPPMWFMVFLGSLMAAVVVVSCFL